jgi:hypothetical protein
VIGWRRVADWADLPVTDASSDGQESYVTYPDASVRAYLIAQTRLNVSLHAPILISPSLAGLPWRACVLRLRIRCCRRAVSRARRSMPPHRRRHGQAPCRDRRQRLAARVMIAARSPHASPHALATKARLNPRSVN